MLHEILLAAALAAAPSDAWDCSVAMPPTGYLQETAYEPLSNPGAVETAKRSATRSLLRRLCGGLPCPAVSEGITVWKTGQGLGDACVMVVVKADTVHEWEASQSTRGLEQKFDAVVAQLLGGIDKKARVAVVIDKIIDEGTPGGTRADWLVGQMGKALSTREGITMVERPNPWAGVTLPPGFDAVLTANVVSRLEGKSRMLEVTWNARRRAGPRTALSYAAPVLIPESAAPTGVGRTDPLARDDGISLHLDTPPGGSLCPGQITQLHVESEDDRYLRVYDLYGKDLKKALLLFPNADHPDGFVQGGTITAIGPAGGFQALPLEGEDSEQFVVIAAKKKSDLNGLPGGEGCRVSPAGVLKIRKGRLAPGAKRSGDGFRISDDSRCKKFEAAKIEELEKQLNDLPLCK